MLRIPQIRKMLGEQMEPGRWYSVQELYLIVESQITIDSSDLEPEAPGSTFPRWRRNVRNLLQRDKRLGQIEWNGDGLYRLSSGKSDIGGFVDRRHIILASELLKLSSSEFGDSPIVDVGGRRLPLVPLVQTAYRQATDEEWPGYSSGELEEHLRRLGFVVSSVGQAGFGQTAAEYRPDWNTDSRPRALRAIITRAGQQAFRSRLISLHGPRCMLSGCGLVSLVDAAHIMPYRGANDHHISNGLLLRTDLHSLFDLGLLVIESVTFRACFAPQALSEGYGSLQGRQLTGQLSALSAEALSRHFHRWNSCTSVSDAT